MQPCLSQIIDNNTDYMLTFDVNGGKYMAYLHNRVKVEGGMGRGGGDLIWIGGAPQHSQNG